jgi:crossover junction endodeoxyribonuclease RuvC
MALTARLYLDLGNRMGWCLTWSDGRRESGFVDFKTADHEHEGARFQNFRGWLHDLKRRIEAGDGRLVAVRYERVDFIAKAQGREAIEVRGGFRFHGAAWTCHHGIDWRGIPVATIKKAITGHHDAPKTEKAKLERNRRVKTPYVGETVESAMARRGITIKDHNERDAVALAICGAA